MSMHKKPLTPLEEEGLRLHHLDIGIPSQLSDSFRNGMAWAQRNSEQDLPIHKANTDKLAELALYCVQRKIGCAGQEAHEAIMLHCDALVSQLTDAFGDGYYDGFLDGAKHHEKTDCNTDPTYLGEDALRCSEIAEQAKSKRMGIPSRLDMLAERDAAMREASELAMCIWRSEFRNESPEFELCDSPAGVISQIDNMFAGIRQQRDALAAQVAAYKERSSELYKLCDELIDHLRYNKAERDEVLNEFWNKQEAIKHVPSDPLQCLAEIKAEAGRAGYHEALQEHSGATTSAEDYQLADQYAARVRQDEQSGTWLKDSNVNGGKRQGGE